jgi:hypothetical protein
MVKDVHASQGQRVQRKTFMIITSDVALDHNKQTLGSLVCIRIHVAPRIYVMPKQNT